MLKPGTMSAGTKESERCDIHVWSGACEHVDIEGSSARYLCDRCETIANLDHEVKHEIFPHVSGDYELMS